MTTLQLVRHVQASGKQEVDTVENHEKKPPMSFKRNGEKPYLLGSERLLELAYALNEMYRINSVTFSDSVGNRLDDEETSFVTSALRNAANASDRAAFNAVLDRDMSDLYVLSVELQDKNNPQGGIVTIYRQGAVEVHSNRQLSLIKSRLSSALAR